MHSFVNKENRVGILQWTILRGGGSGMLLALEKDRRKQRGSKSYYRNLGDCQWLELVRS